MRQKHGGNDKDSDDNNIIVTKAKKGPSLSEINYQTEEIDMIDPLYLQGLPKVLDDSLPNGKLNNIAKFLKRSPRRAFS